MINLQREAGRVSQAEISRCMSVSKSTVSNVFSGIRVQRRDIVIGIALMLGERLPVASRVEREEQLNNLSDRFLRLWERAKAEEDGELRGEVVPGRPTELANAGRRGSQQAAVKQLLLSLSVGCPVCTYSGPYLEIHRIMALSAVIRAVQRLGGRHGSLTAVVEAIDPWELIALCPNCNRLAKTGRISHQDLRERRLGLDRQPDAPRLYGRYLDQILLNEDKEILDLNAVARAMDIVQRAAQEEEP
ncbi:hypothetical protein [Streptomyces sp. NPDC056399]|uniref:hypothetical protein n=1 Tax=Streptomyces sp. NPDC056399 TaxID=3345807 RepID=UPI0035D61E29